MGVLMKDLLSSLIASLLHQKNAASHIPSKMAMWAVP